MGKKEHVIILLVSLKFVLSGHMSRPAQVFHVNLKTVSRQGRSGLFELFFMQRSEIKKASSDSPTAKRKDRHFFDKRLSASGRRPITERETERERCFELCFSSFSLSF